MTESVNSYKVLDFNRIEMGHLNKEESNIGTYFARFLITI
jgi:hypothetical protein